MTSNKVRLQKRELSAMGKVDAFLMRNAPLILSILIVLLFIFVGILIFVIAMQSGNAISMTESGNVYNHFQGVI